MCRLTLLAVMSLAAWLAACGQKGPLRLPDQPKAAKPTAAAASDSVRR